MLPTTNKKIFNTIVNFFDLETGIKFRILYFVSLPSQTIFDSVSTILKKYLSNSFIAN